MQLTSQSTKEKTNSVIHCTYYDILYLNTKYWVNRKHNNLKEKLISNNKVKSSFHADGGSGGID